LLQQLWLAAVVSGAGGGREKKQEKEAVHGNFSTSFISPLWTDRRPFPFIFLRSTFHSLTLNKPFRLQRERRGEERE
jgi:hypothetical protein